MEDAAGPGAASSVGALPQGSLDHPGRHSGGVSWWQSQRDDKGQPLRILMKVLARQGAGCKKTVVSLFGVFDGHSGGPARKQVHPLLARSSVESCSCWQEALASIAFRQVHLAVTSSPQTWTAWRGTESVFFKAFRWKLMAFISKCSN